VGKLDMLAQGLTCRPPSGEREETRCYSRTANCQKTPPPGLCG